MNLTKTYKIRMSDYEKKTRKLSCEKFNREGKDINGEFIGWEYEPPQKEKHYTIYLGNGKMLKTSPVKDVIENFHAILVKTTNSIYQVKYLQ